MPAPRPPILKPILKRIKDLPGDVNSYLAELLYPIGSNFEGRPPIGAQQVTPPSWYPQGIRVLTSPEMAPGEGTASARTVMVGAKAWPWHIKGWEPELDPAMMMHELEHTKQMRRWGPLSPAIYLLHDKLLQRRGKTPYVDNPFEVKAYEVENLFKAQHQRRKTGQGPRGAAGGR